MSGANANVTGPALTISSFDYNNVSGIATVVTTSRHGLSVDSKVRINSSTTLFNGEFIVKRKIDLTSSLLALENQFQQPLFLEQQKYSDQEIILEVELLMLTMKV